MRFLQLLALIPAAFAAPTPQYAVNEGAEVLPEPHLLPRQAQTISGQWIIAVRPNTTVDLALDRLNEWLPQDEVFEPREQWDINDGGLKGFTFQGSDNLARALRRLPWVQSVEPDQEVSLHAYVSVSNQPWGIARISTRQRGPTNYIYDNSAGRNSFAYVIDTGIFTGHQEFGGRASFGTSFVTDLEADNSDGNGHGTHVAGTIGSNRYGVAKATNLIAVKVVTSDGRGRLSDIIAAINWCVNDAQQNNRVATSVINMSLGVGASAQLNQAAANAVSAGVFVAVAAGNNNQDASTMSPASEPTVMTVAASNETDGRAWFSNYGSLVDIFAPGTNVLSTWYTSTTATNTLSGTSMAAPHIAGLAAYLLTFETPRAPAALAQRMRDLSTKNGIVDPQGSPNMLAYNGNNYR